MKRLPKHPNLDHLKKQAKDLFAGYKRGDEKTIARFREALPMAAAKDDREIRKLALHLHDAQSCLAREYGFPSWAELRSFVTARRIATTDRIEAALNWLHLVYPGDISGGMNRARPVAAARMLEEEPDLIGGDAYLACAIGDETVLRDMIGRDAGWINRSGGPLDLLPLIAVSHSSLIRLPGYRDRLRACARLLLEAGADPNQTAGSRLPPASLSAPSRTHRLSALYGASGQNHDAELTKLLLDAGADPNDGESLYHSLENPDCTRLLLEAGASVAGSRALYRVLDLDSIDALRLLLVSGADPNEPATGQSAAYWGTPLLWAIRRGRSPDQIRVLLEAGADPAIRTPDGTSAYTLALQFGLRDVAGLLSRSGGEGPVSENERFVAACSAGDEDTARNMLAVRPDLLHTLPDRQLSLLPELAALGHDEAVRLMVRLGWPIAVRGGDWDASALNYAVFRGDADLTRFLLEHGASWKERHGFGDNVAGTLSWASVNGPEGIGDWLGCAQALVMHGMPIGYPVSGKDEEVDIDGQSRRFSDEVTDFLHGISPETGIGFTS